MKIKKFTILTIFATALAMVCLSIQVAFAVAPTIVINDTTPLSYNENDDVTQIDGTAEAKDDDGDSEWDGGTLEVQITTNAEAADELSIPDSKVGNINTNGIDLRDSTTVIGNLNASEGTVTGSTKLTITFNSNATNALVQQVVRAMHYRNTSDDPSINQRVVTFTVTTNAESASDTRRIDVTAVNEPLSIRSKMISTRAE